MPTIAHIINVTEITEAKKASYLHIAQPLTMKSMLLARRLAEPAIKVDLFATKHRDENVEIPKGFVWAPDIEHYAWEHIDVLKYSPSHKPLPRLKDILQAVHRASDAEYVIYTNVDIGLYPHFYFHVKDLIENAFDAFCINRRDLPKSYAGVLLDDSNLELAFVASQTPHPGLDCFVFRRDIIPRLNLGNVYVGFPPIGQVLKSQIERNAVRFTWVKQQALTFHLGSDRAWRQEEGLYSSENRKQAEGLYVPSFGPSAP